MAYPYTYYPYSQPSLNPILNQPQTNQQVGLTWVQGEQAAKSFLIAPGTTVALWDSDSQTVYLKSADASGMPSIKVLDYTIREDTARTPKMGSRIDFATKDDILSIQQQIDQIKANMGNRKEVHDESAIPST